MPPKSNTCVPCSKNGGANWAWENEFDDREWAIYETEEEAQMDSLHRHNPHSYQMIEVEL